MQGYVLSLTPHLKMFWIRFLPSKYHSVKHRHLNNVSVFSGLNDLNIIIDLKVNGLFLL